MVDEAGALWTAAHRVPVLVRAMAENLGEVWGVVDAGVRDRMGAERLGRWRRRRRWPEGVSAPRGEVGVPKNLRDWADGSGREEVGCGKDMAIGVAWLDEVVSSVGGVWLSWWPRRWSWSSTWRIV